MSGWDKFKANETKAVTIPVEIDEATQEEAKGSAYVSHAMIQLSSAAETIAKNFAQNQAEKNRTPSIDKMIVSVSPAAIYDKDTQTQKQIMHKDGTPAYSLRVLINKDTDGLILFAKENISEGIKFSNLTARTWKDVGDNQKVVKFLRNNEIQSSGLHADLKTFAEEINENVLESGKQKGLTLEEISYNINDMLRENAEKEGIPKDQMLDTYAKYIKNDYGEKIRLASHSSSIVVDLGNTSQNQRYAIATNFDIKLANGGYATAFINSPKDFEKYEIPKEMADITSNYKGFDLEKELAKQEVVEKEGKPKVPKLKKNEGKDER